MHRVLEVACFNVEAALLAQEAGADRIEFCSSYAEGGLTPLEQDILFLRSQLRIPMFVMIRCRAGDFSFSEDEVKQMLHSVTFCRKHGVDGIVTGLLDRDQQPHLKFCERLLKEADHMEATFHRAFDKCPDMYQAAESIAALGFRRILSSGGAMSALRGLEALTRLRTVFLKRISFMPGGGLRSSNVQQFLSLGFNEFHTSAITSATDLPDAEEIRKLKELIQI